MGGRDGRSQQSVSWSVDVPGSTVGQRACETNGAAKSASRTEGVSAMPV